MKISIFPDYPEELWPSMQTYQKNLIGELTKPNQQIKVKTVLNFAKLSKKIGHSNLKTRLFFRFGLNPLLAPFQQGDINHILDQTYGHLVFFLNPDKTVVTCHDLNPLKFVWQRQWKEKIKKELYLLSLKGMTRATRIIAVSQATKSDIVRLLGYPEERIVVIPEGVNEIFCPVKTEKAYQSISKYKLPDKFLLYVGHSGEYKNLKTALRVFALLIKDPSFADFCFIKIGEDFSDKQKKLIKKLGIVDKIKRLSSIPEKDLVLIYNKAACLLHLSLMEGFGLTILEAMACGCPVICSDIPSLRELTAGKVPLVEPDDMAAVLRLLKKILKDKNFREKAVSNGLSQAKKFTWKKTAQKTLKVYETINS